MHNIWNGLSYVVIFCGIALVLVTLLSLINSPYWYLKILNFPRVATLIALIFCVVTAFFLHPQKNTGFVLYTGALIVSIIIQSYIIYPYTPLAKVKVKRSLSGKGNPSAISILVANVLMENRKANDLLMMIDDKSPTFMLTMEVNSWWVEKLNVLIKTYPYQMVFPSDNTYGMALYSKLPLRNKKILFLNKDSVPSFHCEVTLANGKTFQLLTLHPVAPKPSSHPDNIGEEANALIKAGRLIAANGLPAVVAGDFNDVGWSYNTKRFEKLSKLNDIRCGRGMYSTFKANSYIFKWPLDYVYVSSEFELLKIERLPPFGSDHYPFFAQVILAE